LLKKILEDRKITIKEWIITDKDILGFRYEEGNIPAFVYIVKRVIKGNQDED
jgi:hypothetical protein